MQTLNEQLKNILDKLEVETKSNIDMAMMGDTRGDTLYRITGKGEAIKEIASLFDSSSELYSETAERLKAAEDFIEEMLGPNWKLKKQNEAYIKWAKLTGWEKS